MNYDILFCGVGGQGVLSVSAAISMAAMEEGYFLKQSEVHGMSQRGGSVSASIRMSDKVVHSPLIGVGSASLLLSMEPLESLRYLSWLSPNAQIITSTVPLKNIANYPDVPELLSKLKEISKIQMIDADALAREAGAMRSTNMVMVGAASRFLPIKVESLENAIRKIFARKGEKIVDINLKAFQLGRNSIQ